MGEDFEKVAKDAELPTKKELKAAYNEASSIHENHLAAEDVKLPEWGNAKSYWLAALMHHRPRAVHKDYISRIVQREIPGSGRDQQVRHFKRDGWNIEGRDGYHRLADPYRVHEGYRVERAKRSKTLSAKDFDDLKKLHGHRCVTCGAREGRPDRRYRDQAVQLQQGHRDPEQPLTLKNTIPQCQFCNRAYRNDFVFDAKGRVRSVASPRPVLRASPGVQEAVRDALEKKQEKPKGGR